MNAGQRVDVVRRLATVMSDLPYSEIDLILKQFGAPWSRSWSGDVTGYVLHHLGEASDDTLQALDGYFGGETPVDDQPTVWAGDLFRVFLSHSSKDKIFVSELKAHLHEYGIEAFVAHEDIEPTAEWQRCILAGLETCDALAAVLTEDFRSSNWCDQEVGHAIGMRKLILPLARDSMPYGFIGRYQALKCADMDARALAKHIAETLASSSLTSARMAEALVANLEGSRSYLSARANVVLVSRIRTWTPALLRRLEGCLKNDQVSHAFGVSNAIRQILNEQANPPTDADLPF